MGIVEFCSACTGTANKKIAADVKSMCSGVPLSEPDLHRGMRLLHELSTRAAAIEFRRNLTLGDGSTEVCTVQSGDCLAEVSPQYKAVFKGISVASSTCCSSLSPILANSGPIRDSAKVAFSHGC